MTAPDSKTTQIGSFKYVILRGPLVEVLVWRCSGRVERYLESRRILIAETSDNAIIYPSVGALCLPATSQASRRHDHYPFPDITKGMKDIPANITLIVNITRIAINNLYGRLFSLQYLI